MDVPEPLFEPIAEKSFAPVVAQGLAPLGEMGYKRQTVARSYWS
ncbi:hypothetical protein [Stenomitos frigidus]|nr:hypothetical protein [Stenomitos frigidus]